MALKMHPSLRVHPGPWLRRTYVEPYGMKVSEVAAHLGVSRQNMSLIAFNRHHRIRISEQRNQAFDKRRHKQRGVTARQINGINSFESLPQCVQSNRHPGQWPKKLVCIARDDHLARHFRHFLRRCRNNNDSFNVNDLADKPHNTLQHCLRPEWQR